MYRLAILFVLFLNTSAKLINFNFKDDNWVSNRDYFRAHNYKRLGLANRQPLWILSLKNENIAAPLLRIGTEQERRDFNDYAGPLINAGLRSRVVKKDNPEKSNNLTAAQPAHSSSENDGLTKEIFRVINKFALSTSVEPDAYLTDSFSDNEASIDLYFKGDYTSLIVKMGNRVWHYFINPPSPLPRWFYEIQEDGTEVKVPEDVKYDFYKSLLRLLHMFLGYPI